MRTKKFSNHLVTALTVASLLCNQTSTFLQQGLQEAPLMNALNTGSKGDWSQSNALSADGLIPVPYQRMNAFLQAANSGMTRTRERLHRMQGLAKRGTDGTLSTGQRALLQNHFQFNLLQLNNNAISTHFGEHRLLDGSQDALLQGAPPTSIELIVDLPDQTVSGLGLSGATVDVITVSNSVVVLTKIDTALIQVQQSRAALIDAAILLGTESRK